MLRTLASHNSTERRRGIMDTAVKVIEKQLTALLRRGHHLYFCTQDGDVGLERSAYGIMCKLADEGPRRLGALATTYGLHQTTITRQVRELERAGLAFREVDPKVGHAYILDLTDHGRDVLEQARRYSRARLRWALADWPKADLTSLGRLLERLNASVE
jgi:DNA-binding MarR family transcriptional regulator